MKQAEGTAKKKQGMVSNKEILGHTLGGIGQNTIYALWSGFITGFIPNTSV